MDRVHVQRGPQGLRSVQEVGEEERGRVKEAETGEDRFCFYWKLRWNPSEFALTFLFNMFDVWLFPHNSEILLLNCIFSFHNNMQWL